jgi:hypothetical protein
MVAPAKAVMSSGTVRLKCASPVGVTGQLPIVSSGGCSAGGTHTTPAFTDVTVRNNDNAAQTRRGFAMLDRLLASGDG